MALLLCFLGGLCGNRRMIRFPNKQEGDPGTTFTGTQETFDQSKFVPGQVKKGKYQSKLALTVLAIFSLCSTLLSNISNKCARGAWWLCGKVFSLEIEGLLVRDSVEAL